MSLTIYSPSDMHRILTKQDAEPIVGGPKHLTGIRQPIGIRRDGSPVFPISGAARQYLQDGPYIDPPVTAPLSANASTSAVDMWTGATYTPVFANDPKAGKVYTVEAGGVLTTAGSGTLIITPFYGTSSGVAMGASAAQTVAINLTAVPWYLRFVVVFRTIGAAGANSTCIGEGAFTMSGTLATAGSGCSIPFGGTSASVDATLNKDITIQKTLSVAGTFTTHWAYCYSLN